MGEGEAESGTVFCLKVGEEEVVFLFLFFSCAVYSQGVGHSFIIIFNLLSIFFGYHFLFAVFLLYTYLVSWKPLTTTHTHTHTPMAFNFLFFPLLGSRLDCIKREKKKSSILRSCRHVI